MNVPSLHGQPRHPYYIFAPDYRETSSGICVLHYLCHALNLSGYEAYVLPCKTNPNLRTPILTDQLRQHHKSIGVAPIAVYPEVMDGNAIGAPVVVRYILNREGFLTGKTIDAQDSDLFFYYTQDFRGDAQSDNLLLLPVIDSELFSPPSEPVQRSGSYLYVNRIDRSKIDYSLLPDDVEVLSLAHPKTLAQLAHIFRSAAVLYSYEISATCTEAMLCGCPVIYMPGGHVTTQPFLEQFGNHGSALYDEPGGLERARATVMQARMRWLDIEKAFWPQLQNFLQQTQRAASEHVADSRVLSLQQWLSLRQLTPSQQTLVDDRRQLLRGLTRLTLLVRDSKGDMAALGDTLDSIAWWQSNTSIGLRTVVLGPVMDARHHETVHWLRCDSPGAPELNEVLQGDDSDWIMLLEAGDEVLPSGSLMLDLELPGAEGCRMIYCDGIFRSEGGPGAVLRPSMNLDYLLSLPLVMASHWLIRRDLAVQAGGYDARAPQALEFDLILRLIEAEGLVGIAHLEEPLIVSDTPSLQHNPDERDTLLRHLANRGYPQAEVVENLPRHYHIQYKHVSQPLVSILIPSREHLPLLQRCVESLLEKTRYPHFEIILVDNDSESPEIHAWLAEIASISEMRLRVLHHDGPLNLSALYNLAATHARGEFLVLLNNDTMAISEQWLDELLNHALRPETGVVGAKLINQNAMIVHAGLVGGLRGPAGSPFVDQQADAAGYLQRLQVEQNVSAVGAGCLMINRALYLEVGGMDEKLFALTFNDLDLCLKVAERGYLNVWTPHALLMHDGGILLRDARRIPDVRRQCLQEQQNAYEKWLPALANDPAYNKNLSLRGSGSGFDFEANPALTWKPLCWRPLPVVLGYPAQDKQTADERLRPVFDSMRDEGVIQGGLSQRLLTPVELARLQPDVIVIQHRNDARHLAQLRQTLRWSTAFKVLDVSGAALALDSPIARNVLRQAAELVDRVVVPTQALAQAIDGLHSDIRVVENRLDYRWANLPPAARLDGKPRVGCAFTTLDPNTVDLAQSLVRHFADQVDWVLWGDVPPYLHNHARELHSNHVQFTPGMLAALNLDIALALHNTACDPSAGELQLKQLGACGYPVICSDVGAFHNELKVTRVANELSAWKDAINRYLDDLQAARSKGAELRKQVSDGCILDAAHLQLWRSAWMPD
ncbi:glycosyltransferase [Pseudomonas putida]|uniref:glycosyltransferase n=1 Tax=Pseudomonas TaxID=286 RepID=UPI0034657A08